LCVASDSPIISFVYLALSDFGFKKSTGHTGQRGKKDAYSLSLGLLAAIKTFATYFVW
jgi:hypothetical protein